MATIDYCPTANDGIELIRFVWDRDLIEATIEFYHLRERKEKLRPCPLFERTITSWPEENTFKEFSFKRSNNI